MTEKRQKPGGVESVDEIEVCPGCGLMREIDPDLDICWECFNRRDGWLGGGPLRVIDPGTDQYHETPRCPNLYGSGRVWYYWKDEEAMHADLGGDLDKCVRCHAHRTFGFDHYTEEDRKVIGHA